MINSSLYLLASLNIGGHIEETGVLSVPGHQPSSYTHPLGILIGSQSQLLLCNCGNMLHTTHLCGNIHCIYCSLIS